MRNFSRAESFKYLIPLLALALAACDNPVGEHEEHPVGLIVLNAQNQQVASSVGAAVTGTLSVPRTGSTTFTVAVVGEDGDRIEIDDDDELELRAALTGGVGGSVAVQDEDRVVITPSQAGSGTLQITLMHEGHPEFIAPFPLNVAP